MQALISLYDKTGIEELAPALLEAGYSIIASGGTAEALRQLGIEHTKVEDLTGFPSLFGGRVKTLHPAIHGPILADRSKTQHLDELQTQGWSPIDLVVVNLYPFDSDPSVELIDIGGPALVRAGAKNFASVTVIVDPDDYGWLLDRLATGTTLDDRRRLAAKAFSYVATYDARVANWLEDDTSTLPVHKVLHLRRARELRYGENPHQPGAFYVEEGDQTGWANAEWLGTEAPSYLNIFDADGAQRLLDRLGAEPACVIVKHGGPCGVARRATIVDAYIEAFKGDPLSAFGGVVAINRPLTRELAQTMLERPKFDVLVAPGVLDHAEEVILAKRRRSRIALFPGAPSALGIRSVAGGYLVQPADELESVDELRLVTSKQASSSELADAWLAIAVGQAGASNTVAVVKDQSAVGVGQGQPSRVDASKIAVTKAGSKARGGAAASDAFFPFPDGLETLIDAGVTTIVAPSGSVKDDEIAAIAERAGIAFYFAPRRHFRH
ncbi:bifunctional phosphoribosylaminoimidazolecarboxamide formyltransferase/IMP cyclohydrolase [Ferrimicrobium sp.]|uniref:bifunctional phosphoribosylaminoimidazolecarboxamide formyltransferase/IMP cyclohydrolase n=1 Tax=Ferrimicrobium sp. TaxID=2926050 RepID=UPI002632FABD|nr:bifunctional phosphoribosylaminoimidazolecarboxamide formyltransferase/IMP cyclohydrolase [Ferrimicrobium sp.]